MKRVIAGLAFALTLIRMLTAAASAQEYQTVSQLRESVPARWTTTIETKWRDVAIDAEIVTPDVEAIPVVKVGYDLHHGDCLHVRRDDLRVDVNIAPLGFNLRRPACRNAFAEL